MTFRRFELNVGLRRPGDRLGGEAACELRSRGPLPLHSTGLWGLPKGHAGEGSQRSLGRERVHRTACQSPKRNADRFPAKKPKGGEGGKKSVRAQRARRMREIGRVGGRGYEQGRGQGEWCGGARGFPGRADLEDTTREGKTRQEKKEESLSCLVCFALEKGVWLSRDHRQGEESCRA